jgi:hypothetical protein
MPVQEVFTALHRPLMDPVAVLRNSPRHGRRIDQMDGELICWENVSLHCFARISGVNTKNRNENTYQSVTKTGVCVCPVGPLQRSAPECTMPHFNATLCVLVP